MMIAVGSKSVLALSSHTPEISPNDGARGKRFQEEERLAAERL